MDDPFFLNTALLLFMLFGLLMLGAPICFALLGTALIALKFLVGGMEGILGALLINSVNSYPLVAIPLFVFMGEILIRSGSSKPLFEGMRAMLRRVPGGLAHANILSCGIFSACSGSSTATTLAIGSVSYPELRAAGYDRRIVLGSIAAGGSLGILIPPSTMMIIYGSLTTTSVGKLFLGGILPGLMMAGLFCLWIALSSVLHPGWFPKDRPVSGKRTLEALCHAARCLWPVSVLVLLIMGSIYGGYATPTESAALGVVFSLGIARFVYRRLDWSIIRDSMMSAAFLCCMMMICVVGARSLGMALSMLEIPQQLCDFVMGLDVNRYVVWACVVVIYMVLGCLVDGFDLLLITTPVFYPVAVKVLGFDPVWFGVTLVVLLEMSLLTPPVGMNLFVTHGLAGDEGRLTETVSGILPFMAIMLLCLVIMTAFPSLILYLPSLL